KPRHLTECDGKSTECLQLSSARAFVVTHHDDGVYAIAAVIIDSADHEGAREALEALRTGKSPRLHWRENPQPGITSSPEHSRTYPWRASSPSTFSGEDSRTSGSDDSASKGSFMNSIKRKSNWSPSRADPPGWTTLISACHGDSRG